MKRKTERVPGFPGMYRIFCKYGDSSWRQPRRGHTHGVKYFGCRDGKKSDSRKTFPNFQEAKDFWLKTKSPEPVTTSPKLENGMTFGELIQQWRELFLPHKQKSTQVRYLSYLQHYETLNCFVVNAIGTTDVDRLIALWKSPTYLSGGHETRCNYRHEFSLLKGIFNFYVERFDRNYRVPFIPSHGKMLHVKETPFVKKDLTAEQFQRFLQALHKECFGTQWESIYFLARVQHGIFGRIQDAAALHFEDFNFETGIVTVNKKAIWMRAAGYENYIEAGSKRGGGRTVPISSFLRETVMEWMIRSGRRTGLMFCVDGELIPYRVIEYRFTRALKAAKLPFTATHIIRHASLTEAYDSSQDLKAVKELAGHANLSTTDRYAKARDASIRKVVAGVDRRLSAAGLCKDAKGRSSD